MPADVKIPANNWLETIYLSFGLIVLSGAVFPWLKLRPEYQFLRPDLAYAVSVGLIAVVGAAFLLPHYRKLAALVLSAWPLTLLIAWMLLSLVWSVAPSNRMEVLAGLGTATIYGLHLAFVQPRGRMYRILGGTLLAILPVSIAMYAAVPFLDSVAGLFSNRNLPIRLACFAIPLAGMMVFVGNDQKYVVLTRIAAVILLMVALIMVFAFHAFTAKLALAGLLALGLLAIVEYFSTRLAIALIAVGIIAIPLLFLILPKIAIFANETSSFHNRLYHWSVLTSQTEVSHMFGAGLGGFWNEQSGPWVKLPLLAELRHGHNGFIDTWLDLGFVGLIFLAIVLIAIVVGAARLPLRHWSAEGYMAAGMFVVFGVYNVTESSVLPTSSANTMMWAILVALSVAVATRVAPAVSNPELI